MTQGDNAQGMTIAMAGDNTTDLIYSTVLAGLDVSTTGDNASGLSFTGAGTRGTNLSQTFAIGQ